MHVQVPQGAPATRETHSPNVLCGSTAAAAAAAAWQVTFEDCLTALQHLWTKRMGSPTPSLIMNELARIKGVASPGLLCVRLNPAHIPAVFQKFKSASGGNRDLRTGQIEIMEERMREVRDAAP